jgi:PPP family 3-phenylpropionic acid transporter
LVATVIRWLLSAWVETLVPVVAVQVGHVFSFSLFHLAALRLLAQLVPRERSTTGQALYGGVSFGIGGSGGLALAGFLVDRFGTHGAFAAEAAVALTALVPAGWLARCVRSR